MAALRPNQDTTILQSRLTRRLQGSTLAVLAISYSLLGVKMPSPSIPVRVCKSKAGSNLALLVFIFLGYLISGYAQLPLSTGAPGVGQKAPGFTLPDQQGRAVSLADLLRPVAGRKKAGGLVLIFYRGYW